MNNFRELHFISNSTPKPETLHCLYTSIRFKHEKIPNLIESFKIFQDGRSIHVIMEENKIENLQNVFSFKDRSNDKEVLVKLIKNESLAVPEFNEGEVVNISGNLSYAFKHHQEGGKEILSCPIDMKGLFKKGTKESFLNFLARETGLSFTSEINSSENIRFERMFMDERKIYDNDIHKKLMFRNVISIFGELTVEDPNSVQSLFWKSIGKKRSYGFGSFSIEKFV